MPKSALPPWYHEKAAGTGTDWDNPVQGWIKKAWFAYGPRATGWAKWREFPITLFAVRSEEGTFRIETETYERDSSWADWHNRKSFVLENNIRLVRWPKEEQREIVRGYLSAIQYWSKWHIQIQWPFFVAFHYYIGEVPKYPEKATANNKVFYFRFGARRDADKVYWWPSLFLGLTWN